MLSPLKVASPPTEVVSEFPFLCDVVLDEVDLLIVVMLEVHGVTVPEAEEASLALCVVLLEDPHEARHQGLHLAQLLRAALHRLQAVLTA